MLFIVSIVILRIWIYTGSVDSLLFAISLGQPIYIIGVLFLPLSIDFVVRSKLPVLIGSHWASWISVCYLFWLRIILMLWFLHVLIQAETILLPMMGSMASLIVEYYCAFYGHWGVVHFLNWIFGCYWVSVYLLLLWRFVIILSLIFWQRGS